MQNEHKAKLCPQLNLVTHHLPAPCVVTAPAQSTFQSDIVSGTKAPKASKETLCPTMPGIVQDT